MRDEYTVLLEKDLKEANETIGGLVLCIEKILDGDKRYENIIRTVINGVRSKSGGQDEADSQ